MFIYILQSISDPSKFYTGMTGDVSSRLEYHNRGQVKHTSKYRPWKIKNYVWFENETKARLFEQYLKTGSGRAFTKRHF